MLRKIIFLIALFTIFVLRSSSQELTCIVNINTQQLQTTDKHIYETMQAAIYEFMNSKKWTNYTYSTGEKIECTMLITISERSGDVFKSTIQVQSRRPIFKSSYNSTMLNLIDKDFQFNYVEYQTLDFNENSFTSNLTSVLAYYAYIIIGFDFDSYQMKGGTSFFEKAQTIVTNASNAAESGWKAFESTSQKNRYWLVENLLNNIYSQIREANYSYHRKGLDMMVDNAVTARTSVTAAMDLLKKAHDEKPGSYLMQIFFMAKADEIVNIYSNGTTVDKTKVATICKTIDPSNASKYSQIIK